MLLQSLTDDSLLEAADDPAPKLTSTERSQLITELLDLIEKTDKQAVSL